MMNGSLDVGIRLPLPIERLPYYTQVSSTVVEVAAPFGNSTARNDRHSNRATRHWASHAGLGRGAVAQAEVDQGRQGDAADSGERRQSRVVLLG